MTDEQQRFVDRADRALASARLLLDAGDVEAAVNRAYYATFNMALAALRGVGEAPKSHAGVHTRFGDRFIRPGHVAPAIGRLLAGLFDARQRADYGAASIYDGRAAEDALADAERFVAAVQPLVA